MWDKKDFTEIRRWCVWHILMGTIFFISSLLINGVQLLLFVTLRPFNKALYRNINYYLLYTIHSQVSFLAEWWSGSDIKLYTDDEGIHNFGKENAFIVMNHTFEVDFLMSWIFADRFQIFCGIKVFIKNMLKYVPIFGWAWAFSDNIFLHRNWQKDKTIMENQIKELFDYPHPVLMMLFCEGTRFTHAKHKASMEIARQKGLPELKHHLLPKPRGFMQCAKSMRGHFSYIYDITVSYNTKEGADPTFLNMLRGQAVICELYVRRLPLDDVPTDDEGAINYLNNLFQEKDQLLDSYITTGSFTKENDLPSYPLKKTSRRYWSLLNFLGWATLVCSMLIYYYYYLITIAGSLLANAIAITIFVIAYICLYKMFALTKIYKGSEYGNEATAKKVN